MLDEVYQLQSNIINVIGEFVIHWSLFEEFYQGRNANPMKIKGLNLSIFDFGDKPERFRILLCDHIKQRGLRVDEEGIFKVLFTATGDKGWLPTAKEFILGNSDDAHDCLICVYRIRNNLLHGEKEIFSLRSQKDLIQSASDILSVMTGWDDHLRWKMAKWD